MGQALMELLAARREAERLRGRVAQLEAEIVALKQEYEQPPQPEITLLSMPASDVEQEIRALGQKLMYPVLLDASGTYYYTNDEGWADVFDYIYCVFNMPEYIAFRMDCEDFIIWLKGLVSALFGLNYFAITIGDIPQGCHGFGFFRTQDRHLIIEPQLAQFFEWGERGYTPKWALL